uniref:Uncharacterized protein n=1 Tax=Arundo donax TaxID=35708 RepID=A0A0A9D4N9_ARUDO
MGIRIKFIHDHPSVSTVKVMSVGAMPSYSNRRCMRRVEKACKMYREAYSSWQSDQGKLW